jgi:hypothetical protein
MKGAESDYIPRVETIGTIFAPRLDVARHKEAGQVHITEGALPSIIPENKVPQVGLVSSTSLG